MKYVDEEAHEAGKWCCDDGEYITIEEVLQIIDDNLTQNLKRVFIHADCCGAGGAHVRLVKKLRDRSLKLKNIKFV